MRNYKISGWLNMENKLIFEDCKDMMMVRLSKTVTLPYWGDISYWITLEKDFIYNVPRLWALNLIYQNYIYGVEND